MKYRVILSNGVIFCGIRGWRESARECRGFHRFRVISVAQDCARGGWQKVSLEGGHITSVEQGRGHQGYTLWGNLAGKVVVVSLRVIDMMVEED